VAATAQQIRRRLPGIAGKYAYKDEIIFLKGVIIYASERVQAVETDSKIYRLQHLLGSTYLYWCAACPCTVYEEEVTRQGKRACPFCGGPIEPLKVGDKVRLHYRFAKDGNWAQWWGERWEW
jgi:hypothetical protein